MGLQVVVSVVVGIELSVVTEAGSIVGVVGVRESVVLSDV